MAALAATPAAPPTPRDKSKIADAFSKAAADYDQLAQAQKRIAQKVLDLCPTSTSAESRIGHALDIGCGTGYWTRRLRDHSQAQQITGLDLAEGMLRFADEQPDNQRIQWLCADAEQLPLPAENLDLVFSSLAIQWCNDYHALFGSIARTLKPGGEAHIATLLPGTLCELEQSWAKVDNKTHINRFTDAQILIHAIRKAGLTLSATDAYCETMFYPDLRAVFDSIKGVGAHHTEGEAGLTGRRSLLKLKQAYETRRTSEGLPVSYQVLILSLRKP
ncbi:malonyl-[acyl-carrier protein] O-methyltransferase BioC [Oceanospirillum linum]|uniref:Malonyl-[acyl-carrier protein] O-methyltransferase n=2 Tax=Oceanospirillum linum TaxID=966 RepID=A0A1T1HGE7_OCELI|nr:malonyl-[acyl-carrier protein] O-methyltransferase BioC [Oceanospirillum linum]